MSRRPEPSDYYHVDLDTPHHLDHCRDNVLNAGCHRCGRFIGHPDPKQWAHHRRRQLKAERRAR